MPIVYKIDPMQELKKAGFTSYLLRKEQMVSQSTITRLRNAEPISFAQLSELCRLLNKQPGEIIAYSPEESETEATDATSCKSQQDML